MDPSPFQLQRFIVHVGVGMIGYDNNFSTIATKVSAQAST